MHDSRSFVRTEWEDSDARADVDADISRSTLGASRQVNGLKLERRGTVSSLECLRRRKASRMELEML
jgi:hypothetical protein